MICRNMRCADRSRVAVGAMGVLALLLGISKDAEARTVAGNTSMVQWSTPPKNCFFESYGEIRSVNNAPAHAGLCNDWETVLSNVPVITPLIVGPMPEDTLWMDVSISVSGANVGLQAPISCRAYTLVSAGEANFYFYQSGLVTSNGYGPAYQTLPLAPVQFLGLYPEGKSLETVCYFGTGGQGLVSVNYEPGT